MIIKFLLVSCLLVCVTNMLSCEANGRGPAAGPGNRNKLPVMSGSMFGKRLYNGESANSVPRIKLPGGSIFGKRNDNGESAASVPRIKLPGGSIFGKRFDNGESDSIIENVSVEFPYDADERSMSNVCQSAYRSNIANILATPPNLWLYNMEKLNSMCSK